MTIEQLKAENEQLKAEIANIKLTTVSTKLAVKILDENSRLEKTNNAFFTAIGLMAGVIPCLAIQILRMM